MKQNKPKSDPTLDAFLKSCLAFIKEHGSMPSKRDLEELGVWRPMKNGDRMTMTEAYHLLRDKYPEEMSSIASNASFHNSDATQDRCTQILADFILEHRRLPKGMEVKYLIDSTTLRKHFGGLVGLYNATLERNPELKDSLCDGSVFTQEYQESVNDKIKKSKLFVVSTNICSSDPNVHVGFFKSLKYFCKTNNAELLLIPVKSVSNVFSKSGDSIDSELANNRDFTFDPILENESFIVGRTDTALNSNIRISTIRLSAKQIDPVTGLDRLGQRAGSFIFGSPKQRMRFVPTGEAKLPHVLVSTGSINIPDYSTNLYISERTGYIANNDHVLGALVVEVVDNKIYHLRHIQADPTDGSFIDLGIKYSKNKKEAIETEGLVLGDWHSGVTDPYAKKAAKEQVETFQPKRLYLHDVFDGRYNNHHDRNRSITRAKLAEQGRISLVDEIEGVIRDLNEISTWSPKTKLFWVASNHDEVLHRYLEESVYKDDPINMRLASQLIAPMIDGENPLYYAIKNFKRLTGRKISLKANVVFLNRDESSLVAGIECGGHGDLGANGARGSIAAAERAYGNAIIGHAHSPQILRGIIQVGTCGPLKEGYTRGPSSWFHSNAVVYPNGSRQLLSSVEGIWRRKKAK